MTKDILEGSGVKVTKKSLDETIEWSKKSKMTKKFDGRIFGWIGTVYQGISPAVTRRLNRIRALGYYVRTDEVPMYKTHGLGQEEVRSRC
jgi:hypothetical protein